MTVLGPIGRWFQARVNNGVDDAIRMAIIDGHGEVKRAWLIPHRLHDGRSALRQIFRFLDIAFAEPPLNPRMQRMPLLRLLAARPWRSIPVAAAPAWRVPPATSPPTSSGRGGSISRNGLPASASWRGSIS